MTTIAGIFLLPNGTFFIELIVSLVLLFLVYKYVLPPINKALTERQEKIRESLEAADKARAALARLERHYLRHPVPGGWYDQFDSDGTSLVATIPASSFYHVLCASVEAEQVLG